MRNERKRILIWERDPPVEEVGAGYDNLAQVVDADYGRQLEVSQDEDQDVVGRWTGREMLSLTLIENEEEKEECFGRTEERT